MFPEPYYVMFVIVFMNSVFIYLYFNKFEIESVHIPKLYKIHSNLVKFLIAISRKVG